MEEDQKTNAYQSHAVRHPDRSFLANEAREYAVTLEILEPCDRFVKNCKLSAYRLDFQPAPKLTQRLDWTLGDSEETSVVLGSSRRREELDSLWQASGDLRLLRWAATNFPVGTVVVTMLTDEQGDFRFPNVKPGRYHAREPLCEMSDEKNENKDLV